MVGNGACAPARARAIAAASSSAAAEWGDQRGTRLQIARMASVAAAAAYPSERETGSIPPGFNPRGAPVASAVSMSPSADKHSTQARHATSSAADMAEYATGDLLTGRSPLAFAALEWPPALTHCTARSAAVQERTSDGAVLNGMVR